MSALVGRTLNERYVLLRQIGAGGMGEVYRAHDRELDEIIALKIIRPELLSKPGVLERFRSEVKLARRVTHQNVARTFELGRDGEMTYCTMELLEGESLADRLAACTRLSIDETATIGAALCDALAAAHGAGVIHRDIKPDNIMLTHQGRIVLSDFGIAAVPATQNDICGTAGYMAPEQALGEAPSPAADIYSLGVVLYEALSGNRAFTGSAFERIAQAQTTDELRPTGIDDPSLLEAVAAATSIEAARRPTSAELREVLAPRARPAKLTAAPHPLPVTDEAMPALLVRPEHSLRGAAPHLARGFREALIRRLGRLRRVRVVSRDEDPKLATVIELTARQDVIQVVIRGVDAAANLSLRFGAEHVQPSLDRALRMTAAMIDADAASSPPEAPLDPRALDLTWQARQVSYRNVQTVATAVELCERARALAPDDARILANLALCQVRCVFFAQAPPRGMLAAAAQHAFAARHLDPSVAEVHLACGHVELHRGSPVAAAMHFRAAITCAPHLAEAHEWLGRTLIEAGHVIDGMKRLDEAVAMDPSLGLAWWERGRALALDQRWDEVDEGLAALDAEGKVRGQRWGARIRLAAWRQPMDRRQLQSLQDEILAVSEGFERPLMLAVCELLLGVSDTRNELLARVNDPSVQSLRRRAFIGQIAMEGIAYVGDTATGLALLERCVGEGLFDLHWIDRCPLLASLRREPPFEVLRSIVAQRSEAIHDALFQEPQPEALELSRLAAHSPTLLI